MARINIEDGLFKDIRFYRLVTLLDGNMDEALGALVRAWSLAQKWYLKEETNRLIPLLEWEKEGIKTQIIDCGLAETNDGFVRVKGIEEHFKWLIQRSNAGKAGGSATKRPKATVNGRKRPLTTVNDRNRVEASSSISISSSFSDSCSDSNSKEKKGEASLRSEHPPSGGAPVHDFIDAYVLAFRGRFGEQSRPTLSGKVQGQIKQFLKDTPFNRAVNLIQVYFQMEEPWFATKCYDFTTFIENQTKIALALDTGQTSTKKKLAEIRPEDLFALMNEPQKALE